jgi:glycosyltransferase involved in cell wall biosynthesis
MVTPMLPYPQAVNAGPLVMYYHLTAVAARHEVTLATYAGPDPCEWEALDDLQASGIEVRAVWRQEPSPVVRRWKQLTSLAPMPDPSDWTGARKRKLSSRNASLPRSSPVSQLKRRFQQAAYWIQGNYPLRTLQFWDPQMQQLLTGLLAENDFQVIDVHDNAMGSYRYDTSAPTLLTDYEVRHDALEHPRPDLPKKSWSQLKISEADRHRWSRYQPAVWKCFSRIQVFTSRDAEAIGTMTPELTGRVRINPFGVELPKPADPSRQDNGMLVFVGGFCHPPNVDAALWLGREIMPLIRARDPRVCLAIVGSHPPPEVQALAREEIVVTGRVPAVEPYLEKAAVVLAPVRMGGGMRLKVLQAMALGKAVVTTPLGAEGLAVTGQDPPIAIANNHEGIANATLELLAADDHRRALGQRARAFVAEHHSWSTYAKRIEAIYSELVDGAL